MQPFAKNVIDLTGNGFIAVLIHILFILTDMDFSILFPQAVLHQNVVRHACICIFVPTALVTDPANFLDILSWQRSRYRACHEIHNGLFRHHVFIHFSRPFHHICFRAPACHEKKGASSLELQRLSTVNPSQIGIAVFQSEFTDRSSEQFRRSSCIDNGNILQSHISTSCEFLQRLKKRIQIVGFIHCSRIGNDESICPNSSLPVFGSKPLGMVTTGLSQVSTRSR